MTVVKCYGGPYHGREATVTDGKGRFEAFFRIGPPPVIRTCEDFFMAYAPRLDKPDVYTYFISEYRQVGFTAAGSEVRRKMCIALLDGCDLTSREFCDIERDMEKVPWKWLKKPSFLTQFDQWFEYTLNEIGWEQPTVRY
jgi:hypothetical protein